MRGFERRVSFAVQREQEGYGHAVFQTKKFAGDQMVLLALGDHLFRGKPVSLHIANSRTWRKFPAAKVFPP